MKRLLLIIGCVCILVGNLYSQQRYGFVDTEYILSKIPDYKNAQDQLDQISSNWQIEIENIASEIKELQTKFRADEVFLSSEMREKREKEIFSKEIAAQKLQQKYFANLEFLFLYQLLPPQQESLFALRKHLQEFDTLLS